MKKFILKLITNRYTRKYLCGRRRNFLLNMLPKNSIGAEIGVNQGNFSKRILKKVKPKKLYLIDPHINDEKTSEKIMAEFNNNDIVHYYRMKSQDWLAQFSELLDWIYIDGDHTYNAVKKDLELSWNNVKKDGLIAGDNYHFDGDWEGGVRKAVNEFIGEKNPYVVLIHKDQFILKKNYVKRK